MNSKGEALGDPVGNIRWNIQFVKEEILTKSLEEHVHRFLTNTTIAFHYKDVKKLSKVHHTTKTECMQQQCPCHIF